MIELRDGLPCPECGIENTYVHDDGDKMQCAGCHHLWVPGEMPADSEIDDREPDEFADDVDVATTPQEHVDEARKLLDDSQADMPWQVRHGMLLRANIHATLAVAEALLHPTPPDVLQKLVELFEDKDNNLISFLAGKRIGGGDE